MKFAWISLGVLFAVWFVGLIIFARMLPSEVPEYADTDRYEAAIVLTGGRDRIDEGMDLYARGIVDKLYISGVGKGITAKQLVEKHHKDHPNLQKITDVKGVAVDDKARSTDANAEHTKKWIKRYGIKKALLITAGYHMPRSELIFKRSMPAVKWITSPVYPETYHPQLWWKDSRALMLVVSEYHKYFFTYLF